MLFKMNKSIQMTHLCETASKAYYWTNGPTVDQLEEMSTRPLSEYTLSSLLTAGPDARKLHRILSKINSACHKNDPKTVMGLCAWILENKKTYYMEVSMIEVILAYSRAYTLINPDASFILYFSYLYKRFFTKELN